MNCNPNPNITVTRTATRVLASPQPSTLQGHAATKRLPTLVLHCPPPLLRWATNWVGARATPCDYDVRVIGAAPMPCGQLPWSFIHFLVDSIPGPTYSTLLHAEVGNNGTRTPQIMYSPPLCRYAAMLLCPYVTVSLNVCAPSPTLAGVAFGLA